MVYDWIKGITQSLGEKFIFDGWIGDLITSQLMTVGLS